MARVTVEDCLEKIPSRFALVVIAAKRTRQLMNGAETKIQSKNREAVVSLREIAVGDVRVVQDVQALVEQTIESTD